MPKHPALHVDDHHHSICRPFQVGVPQHQHVEDLEPHLGVVSVRVEVNESGEQNGVALFGLIRQDCKAAKATFVVSSERGALGLLT